MNMCTDLCPCDPGAGSASKKLYDDLPASWYAQYGRSSADMVWASAAGEGFDDFYTCYTTVIAVAETPTENTEAVKNFLTGDVGKSIEMIESSWECAGYCVPGMFSISRSISEGAAENDCIKAGAESLASSSIPVGVVGIITGLVLLIAFCFSFPLCCTSCIKQEDKQIM